MIKISEYKGKKILVYGLGRTGISAINSLLNGGAIILAWDDREKMRKNCQKIFVDQILLIDPSQISDIEYLIPTPGINRNHDIFKYKYKILSDIELLCKSLKKAKYIGITGTNGKSTTTSLLGHIFKKADLNPQIGGNIGKPVLELDLYDDGYYILELSSYQLDLVNNMKFDIAILLNITPDHLEYHEDMNDYINTKVTIFDNQNKQDIAIIGVDNEVTNSIYRELLKTSKAKIIPVSTEKIIENGISVINKILYDYTDISSKPKEYHINNDLNLCGQHNDENIAASYAAAIQYINDRDLIISAINSFKSLPHRMEYVGEKNNIRFINDSKATNAESTEKALKSLSDKADIYWILGGVAKENGIKILEKYFSQIRYAFLIGRAQDEFAETLQGRIEYFKCDILENAVELAMEKSQVTENLVNILLSPACASFDQWQDFEERGNTFKEIVTAYIMRV